MDLTKYINNDIVKQVNDDIISAIAEIQQPRSRFQLENFVLNQHDTEEMRYYQCVLEIQSLWTTLRDFDLEIKKKRIKIERLKASNDEIDHIDAQLMENGLEDTLRVRLGAVRELEILIDLWKSFPVKYTRDDIEKLQHIYWAKRLTRQAELDALGNGGKINPAHLDALRQMGALNLESNVEALEPEKREIEQ